MRFPIAQDARLAQDADRGIAASGGPVVLRGNAGLAALAACAETGACSPSADPDWVRLWMAHVNPDVLFLTVLRHGDPILCLPVELVTRSGLRIGRFVGGRHANGNLPAMAVPLSEAETASLLDGLQRLGALSGDKIDALVLERQLETQGGIPNPLLARGSWVSPNVALSLSLEGGFGAVLERHSAKRKRKRFRSSQRKFEAAGVLAVETQVPPERSADTLGSFFAMKAHQFARKGLTDAFGNPAEQAFFKALFAGSSPQSRHHFFASRIDVAGAPRAVLGSSRCGDTLSVHFMAFADDELAQASPGDYLNHSLIEAACADGVETYDLGVGDEGYKRAWCDIETWQRDCVFGLTLRGRLFSIQAHLVQDAKRRIKASAPVWAVVKQARKLLAGRDDSRDATAAKPDDGES
ncbi:MAG: GNAT family N-acetyltransferase [Rhizobiaceae bacterium]|jgi:CelD/BcsL family acetyltransferase involved in cellulose biosynthesis|nr:GNAT family N-acetyltransferase [Rhizobiaceae bacterium]